MVSNNEVDKGCLTILPWVDTMSIDDAFGHCREETASLHNSRYCDHDCYIILLHGGLKALAVNLSRPSGRLWLYVGLIGSNNPHWLKAL